MTNLPAMDRLRIWIVAGTLKMLRNQVAEISPESRADIFGESSGLIGNWETLARKRHAETENAPEPTQRPKTMEAA